MSTITITTDNKTLINILIGACSTVKGTEIKVNKAPKPLRPDIIAIATDLKNGNRKDIETISSVADLRASLGL